MIRQRKLNETKWIKSGVGFLALAAVACAVAAPSPAGTATSAAPDALASTPALLTTEGTLSSMEADGTLILVTIERKGQIVYVRPETKISRNGKPATSRDLRVGDRVVARHGGGGTATELAAEGK